MPFMCKCLSCLALVMYKVFTQLDIERFPCLQYYAVYSDEIKRDLKVPFSFTVIKERI